MVTETNKFGEIADSACFECAKPIKPEWVACPACGASLNASKESQVKSTHSRVLCPGCGDKAQAVDGARLCKKCKAYVHLACMKNSHTKTKERLLHRESTWTCVCPFCGEYLCRAYNKGDSTGDHYVE